MGDNGKRVRQRIAVILAGMHTEYTFETLRGIREGALNNNIDIYIFNANVDTDETVKHTIGEYNIYSVANLELFDGIILFASLIQSRQVLDNLLERIKQSGVPTMCVDYYDKDLYSIGIENYAVMKDVVFHLIEEHGYTKINYLSGQEFNTDSQERLRAYCDALKEHDIPVEDKRIFRGAFTTAFGREAATQIVESGEELPQAIVCATDAMALGVRSVLIENGIDIPGQVALTGFNNLFDARNAVPGITSVEREMRNVGAATIERMNTLINGGEILRKEYFPARPVYSESCGCCSCTDSADDVLKQHYLNYKEKTEEKLSKGNKLAEELIDCQSISEFIKKLKRFINEFEVNAFYLCLDKGFKEDLELTDTELGDGEFHNDLKAEGLPDKMSVALAYENGKYLYYGDFDTKDMLPQFKNQFDSSHVYLFLPLHFRNYFMGYIVLDNSEFAFNSAVFNTWVLNLSICLESMRKQAQLKSMLRKLDKIYMIDPLTGLYNRFGFAKHTAVSFERCIKTGGKIMIFFADLDRLKPINDVYGHEKGDVAICAVADALKWTCEAKEVCARFGGDEFVVYGEGYSEDDAREFGHRFEAKLKNIAEGLNESFAIDASYGYITIKPRDGEAIDKYIDMADNIMYFNKKTKKAKKKSQSLPQN